MPATLLFTLPCRGRVARRSEAKASGVGWLKRRHPTPTVFASLRRSTLPLQGRVRLRRARQLLAERRLCGGETRDRHAERRARNVVEPDLVAERDRGRIAAVLAADAELEALAHLAAALARDRDQFADALAVDRDERIDGENALGGVGAEKARSV